MPRKLTLAGVVAVAAISLGGCGSDSGGDTPAATAYSDATASVGAELAAANFEWIDRERIAEMTGVETEDAISDERLQGVIGVGTGAFSNVFGQGAEALGFDPTGAPQSLVAGVPPDAATRFDGVNADAVSAALQEVGYKPGPDPERLEAGEPNEPLLSGPLAEYGLLNVNRVAIGADSVTFAGSDESLDAAAPADGSLADEPAQQAINGCVDDPVAVIQVIGSDAAASAGLEALALAIPAFEDPDAPVPERICAVTADADADAAAELQSTAEDAFGPDGLDPVTRVPFEDELGKVEISSSESGDLGVVEIVTHPPADTRLGILFTMYTQGALTAALGGESSLPPAPDN
jgi:hypothetical protein